MSHSIWDRRHVRRRLAALIFIGGVVLFAAVAGAQTDLADAEEVSAPRSISLWSTIQAGGVIGYLIILMSLVSGSFIAEHFISIRRERLLPKGLIGTLEKHLAAKEYDQAAALCTQDASYLGQVMAAGLTQIGSMFGFFDMQNAMQEASERELSRLRRKLEYLAFIASSAPMMGLLGTVTGMIRAFNQIALTEGAARPSQLAGGISEALITTCLGLMVAIPTMFFVALFRNRIDSYVTEAETIVEKLMGRFRKEHGA